VTKKIQKEYDLMSKQTADCLNQIELWVEDCDKGEEKINEIRQRMEDFKEPSLMILPIDEPEEEFDPSDDIIKAIMGDVDSFNSKFNQM
jgi:hypothetical protein